MSPKSFVNVGLLFAATASAIITPTPEPTATRLVARARITSLPKGLTTENLYNLPGQCSNVVQMATSCGVTNLNLNDQNASNNFYSCFCLNSGLSAAAQQCISGIDQSQLVGQTTIQTINTLNTLCQEIAISNPQNGNPAITNYVPTPTFYGNVNPNSQECASLSNSITSCGAQNIPAVTSINVAGCLCQPSVNLSNMAAACLNYLRTANPPQSSGLAFFTSNYCNIFATPGNNVGNNNGIFGQPTPFVNPTGNNIINFGQTGIPRNSASSHQITLASLFFGVFGAIVMIL
ncbi:hypothetical protein AA313_de0201990 [Arthrobotrys entomopaga]|nr:hypothetical protein AA313_de0201990 [Arthrobotrys entomopaga]